MEDKNYAPTELVKASFMKRALLPMHIPQTGDVHIFPWYKPVELVGGDFYDIFSVGADSVGVCLADASGHGQSAALIASLSKVIIHTLIRQQAEPAALLSKLNRFLLDTLVFGEFVALTYLLMDLPQHRVLYTSAGQFPILLIRAGTVKKLESHTVNPPLGIFREYTYKQGDCILEPGDKLVMTTDGILEAKDHTENMFCDGRFLKALENHCQKTGQHFLDSIANELLVFTRGIDQRDDWTLLVLERENPAYSPRIS